jgi:hypothetical protein
MSDPLYHLFTKGEQTGPYNLGQLQSMLNASMASADTWWWREGLSDWQPISALDAELKSTAASCRPPPVPSAPRSMLASARRATTAPAEITLLDRGDVVVTDSRFMVGSKTYAIRSIVSVRGIEIAPGFLRQRWFGERHRYSILLSTASGETPAYESQGGDLIGDILEALNHAIAAGRSK